MQHQTYESTHTIRVFAATSGAPTALAAFDRCLQDGNVHDTNLVPLSSVVPAGASVERRGAEDNEFVIGDRLYCVMASQEATTPGATAAAGIAWALDNEGRGGVFVESHGTDPSIVRADLEASLATLIGDRPYLNFGQSEFETTSITCDNEPVSAVVMAIYHSEPWPSGPGIATSRL